MAAPPVQSAARAPAGVAGSSRDYHRRVEPQDPAPGDDADADWSPPSPPRVTATEMMAWVTYAGVLGALIYLAVDTGHPTLGVVASFVVWATGLAVLIGYARNGVLRTPEVVLQRDPLPFPYQEDEPVGLWIRAGGVGSPSDFVRMPAQELPPEDEDAGLAAYLQRAEEARRRRDATRSAPAPEPSPPV